MDQVTKQNQKVWSYNSQKKKKGKEKEKEEEGMLQQLEYEIISTHADCINPPASIFKPVGEVDSHHL